MKKYDAPFVYCSQDQKSRNLLYVVPSFAHLRPVLTG